MTGRESPAARLGHSLDAIHALLRRGDLNALAQATASMEADLAALTATGMAVAEADMVALRQKLDRNALCLQGAARGIRAARRRIAEVRGAATGLSAYDARGQRLAGTSAPGILARRF